MIWQALVIWTNLQVVQEKEYLTYNITHLSRSACLYILVLHTIRTRYDQKIIYTYSGIVLIAANPFARVSLYDPEIIQQYSGSRRGDLDPHLFAIAEDAYRCMIRQQQNQTIIVSGERYNASSNSSNL